MNRRSFLRRLNLAFAVGAAGIYLPKKMFLFMGNGSATLCSPLVSAFHVGINETVPLQLEHVRDRIPLLFETEGKLFKLIGKGQVPSPRRSTYTWDDYDDDF